MFTNLLHDTCVHRTEQRKTTRKKSLRANMAISMKAVMEKLSVREKFRQPICRTFINPATEIKPTGLRRRLHIPIQWYYGISPPLTIFDQMITHNALVNHTNSDPNASSLSVTNVCESLFSTTLAAGFRACKCCNGRFWKGPTVSDWSRMCSHEVPDTGGCGVRLCY